MSFESYKKLYNARGVSLLPMGSRANGLNREWALEALKHLIDANVPVAGGQVLTVKSDGGLPTHTYDAWDCEMSPGETYAAYCSRSILEAQRFISTYREPSDRQTLYEIVLGWGKNVYLMDPSEEP